MTVDERALARAARTDQPDHLARLHFQIKAVEHLARAILEADAAKLDPADQLAGMHGASRLGNARLSVEDVEDPLGARGRPLRGGRHADHRLDPRVEAGNVRQECRQNSDGYVVVIHPPGCKGPHHHQASRSQERHERPEERPQAVDAVVDVEDALVAAMEPIDLALFLRKCLDDAHARDRVRQHAGHRRPGDHLLPVAAQEPAANSVDQPHDERKRT